MLVQVLVASALGSFITFRKAIFGFASRFRSKATASQDDHV